ncbi:hypothetical protein [Campylobacter geochelonis]|uniref:hypothetical protein n=1 Tax=Campylobacter geochelonis TaxID=1780362 RepID=UPI0013F4E467|nr:hypothetical protein [Campylobacter geochelonis]
MKVQAKLCVLKFVIALLSPLANSIPACKPISPSITVLKTKFTTLGAISSFNFYYKIFHY